MTVFIDLLGFGIIIPLLPFYAEKFGATALVVGLLSTSFSLMQFIFAPIWGRISDRIGRRPIILLGLAGSGFSYLVFAFANSLSVLFLARILAGIAGANIATAQAYIADSTTPQERAKGMGLIGAAFGLGFIFGPAIGGTLSVYGFSVPAFVAAAISFANMSAAYLLLPETVTNDKPWNNPRRRFQINYFLETIRKPKLGLLFSIFFLVTFAFVGMEVTFALFGERRFQLTSVTVGYVFAYVGVVTVIVQGALIGRLVKRVGEEHLVTIGTGLMVTGLMLMAFASNLAVLLGAVGLLAIGGGMTQPSISSLISKNAKPEEQGGTLGLAQSLSSLARVTGPIYGGLSFDRIGVQYPFFIGGVIMAVAAILSAPLLPAISFHIQRGRSTGAHGLRANHKVFVDFEIPNATIQSTLGMTNVKR